MNSYEPLDTQTAEMCIDIAEEASQLVLSRISERYQGNYTQFNLMMNVIQIMFSGVQISSQPPEAWQFIADLFYQRSTQTITLNKQWHEKTEKR